MSRVTLASPGLPAFSGLGTEHRGLYTSIAANAGSRAGGRDHATRQQEIDSLVPSSKGGGSSISRQLESQLDEYQAAEDQLSLQRAIAESGEFAARDPRYQTQLDRMKPNPMTSASLASNPPITDPLAVKAIKSELMPSNIRKWEELVELYQKKWQRRRKQERVVRERQEQRTLNMPLRPVRSRRRDVEALVASGAPPELISRTIRARTRISRIESEAVRQLDAIFRSGSATELRRDRDLFPKGFPPAIADVEVSPDARSAIVRWSHPLVDGLTSADAGGSGTGPVRAAALEAAAAAADAGFTSLRDVGARLASESLTMAERNRLDRARAHVRRNRKEGISPDPVHLEVLRDLGDRQASIDDPGAGALHGGASRLQRALAARQLQDAARSLGARKRSTMSRVMAAAEEQGQAALRQHDPAAADSASRMQLALDRHTGLIQRLLAQRMPLKFAVQIRFKKWLGARPADLLQEAALARRAAADPDAWAAAKATLLVESQHRKEPAQVGRGGDAVPGSGWGDESSGMMGVLEGQGQLGDWLTTPASHQPTNGGLEASDFGFGDSLALHGKNPGVISVRSQPREQAVPRSPTSLLRKRVKRGLGALQEARTLMKKKGQGLGPRAGRPARDGNEVH